MKKRDIRTISETELAEFLNKQGEKAFRAKQINEWLWTKGAQSIEAMKNLPEILKKALANEFELNKGIMEQQQKAVDGTTKVAFKFSDGQMAESVYIPSGKRVTVCVSPQTGCKLNCSFCATGMLHHGRDLTAGEIFDQVFAIKKMAETNGKQLTNIVYMGMGEPLLNYENVKKSIDIITGKPGLEMSPSRITLSTAGIIPGIKRLADDNARFHLAVSLHSAIDATRNELMPINKKFPLLQLSEALQYFHKKTRERITFEYLMLKGVNDSVQEAAALADYCKAFPVKINLIEYNPVQELNYEPSDNTAVEKFVNYLENKNMIVNIRRSKGKDIDAACGQLANRSSDYR